MLVGVVVVGDAYVDLTPACALADLQPGQELISTFDVAAGGSAGYAAQVLAILEQDVRIHAAVGDDAFGKVWLAELTQRGVNVEMVRQVGGISTGLSLVVVMNGDRAFITQQGANCAGFEPGILPDLDPKILLIAGFMQTPGLWHAEFLSFLAQWRSHHPETTILLDPNLGNGSPEGLVALATVLESGSVDFILPNREELRLLGSAATPMDAAHNIEKRFDVAVVAKLDRDGALLVERGRAQTLNAPRRVVRNANASGDIFAAVFCDGLAREVETGSAVLQAVHAASKAAGVLMWDEKIAVIRQMTHAMSA